MKCRYKKLGVKVSFKKPDEEIPDCCDAALIRDTFEKLNSEVVYANELEYVMDLGSGIAKGNVQWYAQSQ